MFFNDLKIAWRNLTKHWRFSFINIFGLSVSLAVALLIMLYIGHERSFDTWLPQKENTYRVYRYWAGGDDRVVWTPSYLAHKLKSDFPEVESAAALGLDGETLVQYQGNKFYVQDVATVDSTFFQTVVVPFQGGDPSTCLDQPNSLVITDKLAKRLFGESDPMGKSVQIGDEDFFTVSGVLALENRNTHLEYDMYMRHTWYSPSWTGNNRAAYVTLNPQTNIAAFEQKVTTTINALIREEYEADNYSPRAEDFPTWHLQPLTDIYLHSANFAWISSLRGNIQNLYFLSLIGIIILLVALANYINISTALAMQRAREVGVRKVIGAHRMQLFRQFLIEAFLHASIGLLVAIVLVELLLPVFNDITNRQLQSISSGNLWVLWPALGLMVLTGFLAGAYPALVLSSFKPSRALQTKFLGRPGKGLLRKILVSGQFVVTILLCIVMVFIYRQVNFMSKSDLGFQPEQVIVVPLNQASSAQRVMGLEEQFKKIPGLISLSTASRFPGQVFPDWGMSVEGKSEKINPRVWFVSPGIEHTLGLELKDGRFLSKDILADTLDRFIVNETFLEDYQIENPFDIRLKFTSDEVYGDIIGVVKDFHFDGLHRAISPMIISAGHGQWKASFRLSNTNLNSSIEAIKDIWRQIEPAYPMRYTFLDEDFNEQYAEQERFGKTMLYTTLLTMFIALLGLFGLTAFNVERRTKEIGIRKVLGASPYHILALLSKDLLPWIGLAFILSIPLGWYIVQRWLDNFAYRIPISWWVFALAGGLAIGVAFLTVGVLSTIASRANPVGSLRSE